MFHCPPSQLDKEDAEIMKMMVIKAMATKKEKEAE